MCYFWKCSSSDIMGRENGEEEGSIAAHNSSLWRVHGEDERVGFTLMCPEIRRRIRKCKITTPLTLSLFSIPFAHVSRHSTLEAWRRPKRPGGVKIQDTVQGQAWWSANAVCATGLQQVDSCWSGKQRSRGNDIIGRGQQQMGIRQEPLSMVQISILATCRVWPCLGPVAGSSLAGRNTGSYW